MKCINCINIGYEQNTLSYLAVLPNKAIHYFHIGEINTYAEFLIVVSSKKVMLSEKFKVINKLHGLYLQNYLH